VQYVDAKLPEYAGGVEADARMAGWEAPDSGGDPAKLAEALLQLVAAEKQPAHLLLGSDAVQRMQDRIARDTAETQHWKSLSVSTGF
jgi:hypothetical protein